MNSVIGFENLQIKVITDYFENVNSNYRLSSIERESAMKILNDLSYQPIIGYEIPKRHQVIFQSSRRSSSSNRTSSGIRQLGRTRTHQRIPCEICEKHLIKHHIWSLNR